MPEISRFLGMVVAMYYAEHEPAHFHARYGDHEIVVRIDDGAAHGHFPRRALAHILEWYGLHRQLGAVSDATAAPEDRSIGVTG
jgi:hypothetical protein